ncbi:MAG: restriction endonuclease subunit S, partial [Ignavibacteria bacterium]|nr:restriction endonuclease subunit S [Ignavibacteria bacterium]
MTKKKEILKSTNPKNPNADNGNGWEYCQLEDAVTKGSSNISLNKIKGEDGDYPVFAAQGFVQNVSFYQQDEDYLAIIKDGAGIGRVSKHPAKSSVVATMQYLIPKKGFDIDFIKYFLEGIDFEKHRNGSTIPHIYFKDYKSEKFPKLPLPEQQRIVS